MRAGESALLACETPQRLSAEAQAIKDRQDAEDAARVERPVVEHSLTRECVEAGTDWPTAEELKAIGITGRANAIEAALKVLILCPETRAWLEANDPKALGQAEAALKTDAETAGRTARRAALFADREKREAAAPRARRARKRFEVYNVDTGRVFTYTIRDANKIFGAAEFKEMLGGYLPNWVVTELKPIERSTAGLLPERKSTRQ